MFKKLLALTIVLCLGCIVFISAASAEMVFKYGAAERIRQEIWDNVIDLKLLRNQPFSAGLKDRSFFRFKTSLWGGVDFDENTGLFLKLTSEIYNNLGPYKYPTSDGGVTHLDENEMVFDNLYLKANKVFGLPVDLKIGRQDFLMGPDKYGERFLISDGNPNDGSRTFYFNAAKAKWSINENHNVDFVYITNQWQDRYLPAWRTAIANSPTYYDNKRILNASDEQAFMVYSRNKISENFTVEPYYIFKKEDEMKTPPFPVATPELDLNTVGAYAVYTSGPWTFGGEFAYQFGEYDGAKSAGGYSGQDREGYGGYLYGKHKFADVALKPELELRFVYLSGDDPDTDKNENWNPLFSRAPSWNELLIYTQIFEVMADSGGIPGYWTNSQLFMAKLSMMVTESTKLALSYQYWRANEEAQPLAPMAAMFDDGKERGHLPTIFIMHKFNKYIDAFLQYEYFIPGDFYGDDAKNAQFLRWQLQFKI
jgi:hypothetical protein